MFTCLGTSSLATMPLFACHSASGALISLTHAHAYKPPNRLSIRGVLATWLNHEGNDVASFTSELCTNQSLT